MSNRKAVEDFLYKFMDKLTGTKRNSDIYKKKFKSMSNAAFKKWMDDIVSGDKKISIFIPNNAKETIDPKVGLALGKEMGHDFFEYLVIDEGDGEYTTPVKVLVVDGPIRRASQLLDKKLSVTVDDESVSLLTKQPTGDSAASAISASELQIITDIGLSKAAEELFKLHGGDHGSYIHMVGSLGAKGSVSQAEISQFATGTQSTKTLKSFMVGKHLTSNL